MRSRMRIWIRIKVISLIRICIKVMRMRNPGFSTIILVLVLRWFLILQRRVPASDLALRGAPAQRSALPAPGPPPLSATRSHHSARLSRSAHRSSFSRTENDCCSGEKEEETRCGTESASCERVRSAALRQKKDREENLSAVCRETSGGGVKCI
jgi:hypothetical protein